jgi:hypothetical protein
MPRLEGRRSIQLSYGRSSCVDSKPFIAKKSMILGRSPLCRRGRRSTKLSYGPILPIHLILLKLQNQFAFRFFRNLGATWSNR